VSSPGAHLERLLGAVDAASVIVANVVGVGIFTAPGVIARIVPRPWPMLAAWAAGGALAFAGANAYAELGAQQPRAGGEYIYLREAFSPLVGFLTGWTSFVAGFSGAIAATAVGFAAYLGRYLPAASETRPLLHITLGLVNLNISPLKLTALVVIFAVACIHVVGVRPGKRFQNTITAIEILAFGILITLGFFLGRGSFQHFANPAGSVHPVSWLLALVPIMFAYSGWNAAAYVAEEVREPSKNIPRALLLGTTIVTVLYLLLNALYLYALDPAQLAGIIQSADAAAGALFGNRGAALLTPLLLVTLAGSLSATTLAGPRVYFAMARDGLFWSRASQVHSRYRTPATAILVQAAWSGLLVISGTFEELLIYTGFAVVLFSGMAVAALFVLRRQQGAGGMPFGSWGYPFVPAVFVIAAFAIVVNAVIERPRPALAGVLLIIAGVPLYLWMTKRGRRTTA
jgi:basic amino acid/polyamine antiporter, APA family